MEKDKKIAIAKVIDNGIVKYVRYHFISINDFIHWLNLKFIVLCINIYLKKTRSQIASWTKKNQLIYF